VIDFSDICPRPLTLVVKINKNPPECCSGASRNQRKRSRSHKCQCPHSVVLGCSDTVTNCIQLRFIEWMSYMLCEKLQHGICWFACCHFYVQVCVNVPKFVNVCLHVAFECLNMITLWQNLLTCAIFKPIVRPNTIRVAPSQNERPQHFNV